MTDAQRLYDYIYKRINIADGHGDIWLNGILCEFETLDIEVYRIRIFMTDVVVDVCKYIDEEYSLDIDDWIADDIYSYSVINADAGDTITNADVSAIFNRIGGDTR